MQRNLMFHASFLVCCIQALLGFPCEEVAAFVFGSSSGVLGVAGKLTASKSVYYVDL
jgi:hypothetical protein